MFSELTAPAPDGNQSTTAAQGEQMFTHAPYLVNESPPTPVEPPVEPGAVVVRFKKSAPVEIEIDADLLTWEDTLQFQELRDKNANGRISDMELMDYINDLLTKLTGQNVRKLPARVVNALIGELGRLAGDRGEASGG